MAPDMYRFQSIANGTRLDRFESCRHLDAPLGRNSSAHSQRSALCEPRIAEAERKDTAYPPRLLEEALRIRGEAFRPNCVSRSDLRSNNARRMNVSRAYISKALSGDVNFSFSTACRFARALEMDFLPGLAPREEKVKG